MFSKKQKGSSKRGFAVIEMLIVAAIIAVVCAFGVSNVLSTQRGLEQRELDGYAEIIFNAAQNRLTELRTSGRAYEYQSFGPSVQDNDAVSVHEKYGATKGPSLASGETFPCDLTDTESVNAFSKGEMCYLLVKNGSLLPEDSLAYTLLPKERGDTRLWNGSWVVEYNFMSGTVYSVFFSEKPIDYDIDLFDGYRFAEDHNGRDGRRNKGVGYYGGGSAPISSSLVLLEPTVTVTNAEELKVKFECPVPEDWSKDLKPENIFFRYTIYQLDEEGLRSGWQFDGTEEASAVDGVYTFEKTLDSLTSHFKNNVADASKKKEPLRPGSNMMIVLEAEGKQTPTDSQQDADRFNSLFSDTTKDGTAELSYPRHLQNLNKDTSGVEEIEKAKLLNDINWPSSTPFVPIVNPELQEFDGNNKEINNLETDPTKGGGLFGPFSGNEIKNLTLNNPIINVDKDSSKKLDYIAAGAVAAYTLNNTKLTNIDIVNPAISCDGGPSGGLIGLALNDLTVKDCGVRINPNTAIQFFNQDGKLLKSSIASNKYAGGILGEHFKGTFSAELSYAAVVVGDNTTLASGGLVGHLNEGNAYVIKNAYADTYVIGIDAGGLVGTGNNVTGEIQSAYAAGYLYGTSRNAGICLTTGTLTVNSAYTVDEFMTKVKNYPTMLAAYNNAKLYYLNAGTESVKPGTKMTTAEKTVSVFQSKLGTGFDSKAQLANAYNLLDQKLEGNYDYPGILGLPHYCDWGPLEGDKALKLSTSWHNAEKLWFTVDVTAADESLTSASLTYTIYEKLATWDATAKKNIWGRTGNARTLNVEVALNNGTGSYTAYLDDLTSTGTQFKNLTLGSNNIPHVLATGEDTSELVFKNFTPGCRLDIVVSVSEPFTLAEGSTTTLSDKNSLFDDASGNTTAHISNGRHLQNLHASYSGVSKMKDVEIRKDISFGTGSAWQATYPGKTFLPIVNNKLNTMKGNNHTISNLTVQTVASAGGLFGTFGKNDTTARTISNLTLASPSIQSNSDSGAFIGNSVGTVTLLECAVTNPTVTVAGGTIGYEKKIVGYEQKVTGYQQKIVGYEQKIVGYEPKIVGYQQKIVGYQQKVVGYDQKIVGYQQKVTGYQQKVVGYEQKIVGYEQKKVLFFWVDDKSKPIYGNDTSKPIYADDTTKPIYGNDTTKPIYGDDTSKPIYENDTTKPIYGNDTTKPIYGNDTTKPIYGDDTTKPIYGDDTTKPLYGDDLTKPIYGSEDDLTKPVFGEGNGSAGGLIGLTKYVTDKTYTTTLSGCKVYYTGSTAGKGTSVNAIAGKNGYSGGLIGNAGSGKTAITESFAAAVVGSGTNSTHAGGLVGRVNGFGGCTISKSYADCYVYGQKAAGMLGKVESGSTVSVTNCYAAGYLYGTTAEFGLANLEGTPTSTGFTNCYTLTKSSGKTTAHATINTGNYDGLYYANNGFGGTSLGSKITAAQKEDIAGFATKLGTAFSAPTEVTPYNLQMQGLTSAMYPLPVLTDVHHYGDWVSDKTVDSNVKTGLVYYEVYSDNTVGLYYPTGYVAEGFALKTLAPNDAIEVIGDGYGIAVNPNDMEGTVSITSGSNTLSIKPSTYTAGPKITNLDAAGACVCGFPTTWMNPKYAYNYDQNAHSKPIYYKVSATYTGIDHAAETYQYIPFYAKAFYAANISTDALPTNQAIVIRSPRQLYALSWLYTMYQGTDGTDGPIAGAKPVKGSYFSQEADLVYDDYQWSKYNNYSSYTYNGQQAIGSRHNNFISNYEGNGHYVKNVVLTGRYNNNMNYTHAGLFGYVDTYKTANTSTTTYTFESSARTTISNLYLYTDEDITVDGSAFAGAFVSVVQDAIVKNCGVTGYNVSYNTDDGYTVTSSSQNKIVRIGGFAGNVERGGTVQNCFTHNVDVSVTQAMTDWSSAPATGLHYYAVGGFVGWAGDEEGSWKDSQGATVKNCYAGGTITSNNSSAESVAVAFGTFAGRIRMDKNTNIANNLAAVTVKNYSYTSLGKTKTLTPKIFAFASYYNFKSTDYTQNNCPYNPSVNGYLSGTVNGVTYAVGSVPSGNVYKRGVAVTASNYSSFITSNGITTP